MALAPEPGGPQVIGETSGAAEAFGLRAGMRLGEALSRCPDLSLVAADPVRAAAPPGSSRCAGSRRSAPRSRRPRPGEAFFATAPLHGLYGLVRRPRRPEAVLARARRALRLPAKLGAGPNRLCAREAAARMRARRAAARRRRGRRRSACSPSLPVRVAARAPSPSRARAAAVTSDGADGRGDVHRLARAARGAHPRRARRAAGRRDLRPLRTHRPARAAARSRRRRAPAPAPPQARSSAGSGSPRPPRGRSSSTRSAC